MMGVGKPKVRGAHDFLNFLWRCHIAAFVKPDLPPKRVRLPPPLPSGRIRSLHCLSRRMSSSCDVENEELFRYSGGRWLWNEEKQLQDRYKRFNVPELQNIAVKSVGAQTCVSMIKLAEGGSNKVFRLIMDDGSIVIARIPYPNPGPTFRTTASEVATMDFVR